MKEVDPLRCSGCRWWVRWSAASGWPAASCSNEAAAEIYLFVEHMFLLIEWRYGHQIRRHSGELEHPNLAGPDYDAPLDNPLF